MAALNAPGRTITVAGKPVNVLFTTNRLIAVEERYGSLEEAGAAMGAQPLKAGRFLLWISTGKITETDEEFGDLDIAPGLAEAIKLTSEAFGEAIGATTEAAVGPTKRKPAPTPGPTS